MSINAPSLNFGDLGKKPEVAVPVPTKPMNIRQKIVELRKAVPTLTKEKHSQMVSYKYAQIYDIWKKITPVMNQLGVDFDVLMETNTRLESIETQTKNGTRLMWLYEADLACQFINAENPAETADIQIHACGWNDDPAKAKGAAHTYALKYYLFDRFCIDQGDEDPDAKDYGAQNAKPYQKQYTKPQTPTPQAPPPEDLPFAFEEATPVKLEDVKLTILKTNAKLAGLSEQQLADRTAKKYHKTIEYLTQDEYAETLNAMKAKSAVPDAEK